MNCPECACTMFLENTYDDDLTTPDAFYHCVNEECSEFGEPVDAAIQPLDIPTGFLMGTVLA